MTALPGEITRDLARRARATVLVGRLHRGQGHGLGAIGVLSAVGPDAPKFLHSQLTNEVEKLAPGEGNVQGRVERTGHLKHLLSLHRLPVDGPPAFLLLTEASLTGALFADLDAFLFADDVQLVLRPDLHAVTLQGPQAAAVGEAVAGPLGFEPWSSLPEGAVRALRRTRQGPVTGDAWVIRRSLGGDEGFVLLFADADTAEQLGDALDEAASTRDGVSADADAFSDALEILRIEAGTPRIGPETTPKRRLLPETGIEQSAVSYSKGCYLGQEVIARVRTYGSVPTLLRALVYPPGTSAADLPAPGDDLLLADGSKVGAAASRTWSVDREAPVVLAFLDRAHRAPGVVLPLASGAHPAVHLLPLYAAPDTAGRARALYERAVRTYADGDVDAALAHLEHALRLDPGLSDAYEAIGVILGKAGRYHEAIDVFRRLEEVAPSEPMVNTNLSLYYMKLGDKETAEDESGKATLKTMTRQRHKPGASVDADLQASKQKDAARKAEMFRKVLLIDDADGIALFGLGNALLTLGKPDEALPHLQRAVEVDKNNSPVWLALGKTFEKLDRTDDAVTTYRQGIEVASRKGDLMPLKEMEHRLLLLGARR